MFLGTFTYDAAGPATQTFFLPPGARARDDVFPAVQVVRAAEGGVAEGSACRARWMPPAASLPRPPTNSRAHARLPLLSQVVHDNHGHEDFTCVYRVRVHGFTAGHVNTAVPMGGALPSAGGSLHSGAS